jgi:ATP-dependent DNA helicase RecQ
VLENFTYGDTPSTESVQGLVEYLLSKQVEFDISTYELSNRFDLRPLVLNTALTYLELQGVISAQSPFYTEYKIQFLQDSEFALSQFDPARADFLRRLFAAGKKGTKWLTLNMIGISEKLQEPRERIIKALDYLAEKDVIELRVASLRQTYRNMGMVPEAQNLQELQNAQDLQSLLETLYRLFAEREARDITRIQSILAYANNPKCLSQQLIEYFGEAASPCGICSHCCAQARGEELVLVESLPTFEVTTADREQVDQLISENHAALQQTRQLARFLCGLPSPATTRSSLKHHKAFGALSRLRFQQLFTMVVAARALKMGVIASL